MNSAKIRQFVKESVIRLLDNTISTSKIDGIVGKQELKTHFIPLRYRIFGGLLQSLNIQFGNFIEVLLHKVSEAEKHLEIVADVSGKKNVYLSLSSDTDALIDRFITGRQNDNDRQLAPKFTLLLKDIVRHQTSSASAVSSRHDIDLLFRNKADGIYYYVEIKYNDDHDTGKFVDINRKFIKTYAGLVKKLGIGDVSQMKPILYYLNKKVMKGNIYVPEETHIYRGEKLFDEFFSIKYSDLDECLRTVSEDKDVVAIFDNLYKKIRYERFRTDE